LSAALRPKHLLVIVIPLATQCRRGEPLIAQVDVPAEVQSSEHSTVKLRKQTPITT
jgi:hypothetical protein